MNAKFETLYEKYIKDFGIVTEKKSPCWDGYEKVRGKKDYEKGSCRKKKKQVKESTDFSQTEIKYMSQYIDKLYGKSKALGYNTPLVVWEKLSQEVSEESELQKIAKYIYVIETYMYGRTPSPEINGSILSSPEAKSYIENSTLMSEGKKNSKCTKVTKKASSSRKDKKWMKCAKQPDGSIKRVHWGDPNAKVTGKSGNTERKKNFRARHNCKNAKKGSAQAMACKDW